MVVARNGLSKRAKIPGLKPNELFNAENGGTKKNHKLGTRGKRTYDDDESEMKLKSGLKKKRVFGNNGNKVRDPSVSSRTMWLGSAQSNDENKPSSRNLKPKSVGKSSDSSKVVTFTSSSRRDSGDKRRVVEEPVGVDDKPAKAKRVVRIDRGDISNRSVGKFSNSSKVGAFSSSSKRSIGNKRRVSEKGLGDKPMQPKRFIRTDRGDISNKSVGKFSNSSKVGTFSSLSKRAIGYKRKVSQEPVKVDEKPMKTKRVIRIHRGDISNKRIFDDIGDNNDNDKVQEKRNDSEEKNNEMSKNAQFRAIKPSSSILSYVEDNLLGRRRLIELRRAGYNTELSAPLDNIPDSTSTERERIEDSVFRNKLEFFAAAKVSSSFPPPELPEIAFAGRSNVGKSSLLNSLTRQWGVARTSDKPGLTQTINFFNLGTKLCLVDLPGYGFAYAKEEVKDSWEELVKEYVSTRDGLKRVCLLVDTKWGMKPRDHELIDLMERAKTKYQIILTKTDLVFPIDVARRAMQIEEKLKAHKSVVQPVVMVSSKSGAGIRSLRTVLTKIGRLVK